MSDSGQIASRLIHKGRIVELRVDTVRFPDGSTGEIEVIRHSGAAAVVALLGDAGEPDPEVLLVHQYRYAAGGYIWEIPAGRPSQAGEPWEQCARRELEEETGFSATVLRPLTTIHTTPGFTDERIHIFLGSDVVPGAHSRDADEFMEVVPTRLSRALEMVRDGTISDAKTISGLLYAGLFVFGC